MAKAPAKNEAAQQELPQSDQETSQALERRRAIEEMVPELIGGGSHFSRDDLVNLASFDDAVKLVAAEHGSIVYADQEIGDGFAVLTKEQKKLLVGVPLLLMEWAFRKGDVGNFVSIRVIARNPDGGMAKYIVNDGSTGIAEQLADYQNRTDRMGGMLVAKGFRESNYEVETPEGLKSATTYYLDTGKA